MSTNNRLGWKGLSVANTLAYYENSYFTAVKRFKTLAPGSMLELLSLLQGLLSPWLTGSCMFTSFHLNNVQGPIGLHHPLDGVTNPKNKLLCFIQLTFFKKESALAFKWDTCCHLTLCLRLILFHFIKTFLSTIYYFTY